MSESEYREALAEALCRDYHPMHWDVAYGNRRKPCEACKTHAVRILASPVLAQMKREWQAEALREAADDLVRIAGYSGPYARWIRDRAEASGQEGEQP